MFDLIRLHLYNKIITFLIKYKVGNTVSKAMIHDFFKSEGGRRICFFCSLMISVAFLWQIEEMSDTNCNKILLLSLNHRYLQTLICSVANLFSNWKTCQVFQNLLYSFSLTCVIQNMWYREYKSNKLVLSTVVTVTSILRSKKLHCSLGGIFHGYVFVCSENRESE